MDPPEAEGYFGRLPDFRSMCPKEADWRAKPLIACNPISSSLGAELQPGQLRTRIQAFLPGCDVVLDTPTRTVNPKST